MVLVGGTPVEPLVQLALPVLSKRLHGPGVERHASSDVELVALER
jgi:hypothetical protein